ncbi:MAG: phosphatidate cytidylyltransferase, partial [Luteimonas sp.]
MTKTRVLAALALAPLVIAAMLLLPTPWLVALAAVLFLAGLWEWFRLADVDDTLARSVLLVANLTLMVAIVWASHSATGGSLVLFRLATVVGVIWWLLAALWLKHYTFASDHDTHARAFKLAAGTLAVVPAWCAVAWIHAEPPYGHRWLLVAIVIVWAADSGAYFVGRHYGKRKLSP